MGFFFSKSSRCNEVKGPHGGIHTTLSLPEGFDPSTGHINLVIMMHGFIANSAIPPVRKIARCLCEKGYAVLCFDFDAHGKSEGRFADMTISSEIADARAVYEYAQNLRFVDKIAFLGHSQGGVVAGMLAGILQKEHLRVPDCLIQLAPAAVLKDDALAGRCMNARYNPKDPPQYVRVLFHKLGRDFILEAQKLSIYETSSAFGGKVCLIHGSRDTIVPVSYSEMYFKSYPDSQLNIIEGENHLFNKKFSKTLSFIVKFLDSVF